MYLRPAAHQPRSNHVIDVYHKNRPVNQKPDSPRGVSIQDLSDAGRYPDNRRAEHRQKSHYGHDGAPEKPVGDAENQETQRTQRSLDQRSHDLAIEDSLRNRLYFVK